MNILFTSVGRRNYLLKYFREAMESTDKMFAANSTKFSSAFLSADEWVVAPTIYNDKYIPFLVDFCKEREIDALISLFDVDLPVLSRNKGKFEKIGTKVIVSDSWFVDICNDKLKTFNFLSDKGFNVPRTYVNVSEVKRHISEGKLAFPLMVKPRWGMGSIGVHQADDMYELEFYINKTKKEITQTYLKYESLNYIDESVLVQEKIVGQEYGMDVFNDLAGNFQNAIVKKKIQMRSGETDAAVTLDDPELVEVGRKLSKLSRHVGNLDVDVFKDINGKNYILEMNARFGGGYPFSHLAGADLPKAIVHWLKNEAIDDEWFIARTNVYGQKDIDIVSMNEIMYSGE